LLVADLAVDEYRSSDETEVLEVLRRSLGVTAGQPHTSEFWRWKHFDNPFGPSLILLGRIGGEVVGVRAYLRWRFCNPSGVIAAYRAVDTATHPDHQRKGVFRQLTLEANRRAEAAGVDLVFNTPNSKSLPGYLSMGWSVVGKPRVYLRLLRPLSLLMGSRLSTDRLDAEQVIPGGNECRFEEPFTDRPPLGLRTQRSLDYLRWRFERHPTVAYRTIELEGNRMVVRANHRRGRVEVVVSEVLGGGRDTASGLGQAVDADYVVGSARPRSPEAQRFVRSGFLPVIGRGLTLVALPFTPAGKAALSLSAWDLSAGDLELL
jgi:GNAT superfamily N-acetyltransferase